MILLTGASGFLGRPLGDELEQRNRKVRRAVRTREGTASGAVAVGNIGATTDWSNVLVGASAVVHCAARAHVLHEEADPLDAFRRVNRDATLALARAAAAAGVRRFVFISSIGVNGAATHGVPFKADDQPNPQSPYAVSKWEAEQGLTAIAAKTGMEVVIVRPPLVIGPNAKGNLGSIARLVRRGVPLPFSAITGNRRDLVSLHVLIDLLICCLDHAAAPGHVFLAGDGVVRSTADVVRAVARAEGRRARLLPIPPALIGAGLRLAGRAVMAEQLLGDLEVDIGPTRKVLDWTPPVA